jgi:hypothetical protein
MSGGLPGADIVSEGLQDLANRRETSAALLVSIGSPRLRLLGWAIPFVFEQPEERLYHRLAAEYGDGAHSRYNALIRQLVSFQRAAASANRLARGTASGNGYTAKQE